MVYITGEDGIVRKYACKSCIKGHRSSGCQHSDRELVEIRKKGRPISQCAQCRNLRKTKQVHIKCMCHKRSEGNRKELSTTTTTASSSSSSTPSPPVTQSSPILYNNTKNDHHNDTVMDNNELISQESQLQSLLTKTCTRCDRPQSYCICTFDNRSNSSEHDYFSSASSDGSVTPPVSSPMDLQTITNNNNHSPIHRYQHHHNHNSLKIVIPSNFTNRHITNQPIKHNNNSNNNTIDTTTSTLTTDNNNNHNNTNSHSSSPTSTITFNNNNNNSNSNINSTINANNANNSSSYPTPHSNPHTSSILSPAGLHTLIPIHDPTDDLDSDTPIYKSEVQAIDRSEVLGKLNNTTSEELMHQIYNEFSAETQKLTHPPISFVVADDDDEHHHHSHSHNSSGFHTPNTHSRKPSLDNNNITDVKMNITTTSSSSM